MSEYKEVLHKWAKKFVKENRGVDVHTIVRVDFGSVGESGYCETCYDSGYSYVEIVYHESDGTERYFYETTTDDDGFKMGSILQELFRIAEEEGN